MPEQGEQPTFAIARGMRDQAGRLQGIIVATADVERVGDAFAVARAPGAVVALIDRQGRLVYRFPTIELGWEERSAYADRPEVAAALAGQEVTSVFDSPIDGRRRLNSLAPVRAVGWAALVNRPEEEVLAPVAQVLQRDAALLLAVSAAAFAGALVAGQRLTRRLGRLQRMALAVGRGDYEHYVHVAGPAELEAVATALNRMVDEIRFREEQRDDLLRAVSHDLRQPLTVIQAQAQLTQRTARQAGLDSAERSAGAILTSAQRMNAMIQDLVDSARLEAGQLRIAVQPVQLPTFVSDLRERMAGTPGAERIRVQPAGALPAVLADPDRLERILSNLLSNAIKYSTPGTEITVTFDRRNDEVVTSVSDRGPGIAPEELPHLFERYYRARTERERAEGVGLGLYITRLLVQAHGGRIWVDSQPGQGSTFSFSLPAA